MALSKTGLNAIGSLPVAPFSARFLSVASVERVVASTVPLTAMRNALPDAVVPQTPVVFLMSYALLMLQPVAPPVSSPLALVMPRP